MKKIVTVCCCLLVTAIAQAQLLRVYYENKEGGFEVYADNFELCPVSLIFTWDLKNLSLSESLDHIFVLPAQAKKFKLTELATVRAEKGTGFNYRYKSALGDVTLKKYDSAFVYDLPFEKGKHIRIYQGYQGTLSHQDEYALDFTMPEGTPIMAAREGTVVQVVQHNSESCPQERCKKFNNYVIIMHSDGTYAYYAHIKQNGAHVKLGGQVKKGDLIAYSGNVGWTSGPHLHFCCFIGNFGKWRTFQTKFRVDRGDNPVLLQEGNLYGKDY